MAEKFNPDAVAADGLHEWPGAQDVDADMIYTHVIKTWKGPAENASAFAIYADDVWWGYNDGSGTQTNAQILAGILAYWRGE
jgi:hypothetical protein